MPNFKANNLKSYTGSQLAPNLMTLNDLESQNRGFYGFFGDFGLRHKSISFTMWQIENLHYNKFMEPVNKI